MLAQKDSLLSTYKANPIQENSKKIKPYYLTHSMLCSKGHDKNLTNRKDGKCGKCHTMRQSKYRKTTGRNSRNYYKMKYNLKSRIKIKREKIAQLEREEC